MDRRDVPRLAAALRRLFFSDAEPCLTVSEAAARLGRSVPYTYKLVQAGCMGRRERGRWVVPLSDLDRFTGPGAPSVPEHVRRPFSFFAKS